MKKSTIHHFFIMTVLNNFVLFTSLNPSVAVQSNGIMFDHAEDPDTDGIG